MPLAIPFSRFYSSSLLKDMTRGPRESRAPRYGNRCRLSQQSIRDLEMQRKLPSTEIDGCPVRPLSTNGIMHKNAANVRFGGRLDVAGNTGDPGQWQDQGIWEGKYRADFITVREPKAIRTVHMGTLRDRVKKKLYLN
jgi:hypothetical protein